jgi:hypothetical protein
LFGLVVTRIHSIYFAAPCFSKVFCWVFGWNNNMRFPQHLLLSFAWNKYAVFCNIFCWSFGWNINNAVFQCLLLSSGWSNVHFFPKSFVDFLHVLVPPFLSVYFFLVLIFLFDPQFLQHWPLVAPIQLLYHFFLIWKNISSEL